MPAPRQSLWLKKFACFAFEALKMNRARSWIRCAHLSRNLFAQRHAVHEMRLAAPLCSQSIGRRVFRGQSVQTGQPRSRNQSISRRVRRVVAVHFANVFNAPVVAHQQRNAFDQLRAIFRDRPRVVFQQLIHPLPAAHAIVVRRRRPRQTVRHQHIAQLLRDRRFRRAMRKRIRRKKYLSNLFPPASFHNRLRQHPRRKPVLQKFPVRYDASAARRLLPSIFRHRAMPIHRARMMKSPIDRNPARQPRFQSQIFRPRRVPSDVEHIEILPRENVPIAFQKRAAQMFRQRFERLAVLRVVRVDRIVVKPRANKIVLARVVKLRPLKSRRRRMIHPKRLYPRMTDIPRIRRARHARKTSPHRTPVARRQKLTLLQRKMRKFIEPDEQKLRALILINVVLAAAISKTRGRTVQPRHHVLRFVVTLVKLSRHIAPEIRQQRTLQLRIRPPQKQRVAAVHTIGLRDRFPKQSLGFSRPRRAAKQPVFRVRFMKLVLPLERRVVVAEPRPLAASLFRRVEPFNHLRSTATPGCARCNPRHKANRTGNRARSIAPATSFPQKTPPLRRSTPRRPANDANSSPRPPPRKSPPRSARSLPQTPISDCSYFPPPKIRPGLQSFGFGNSQSMRCGSSALTGAPRPYRISRRYSQARCFTFRSLATSKSSTTAYKFTRACISSTNPGASNASGSPIPVGYFRAVFVSPAAALSAGGGAVVDLSFRFKSSGARSLRSSTVPLSSSCAAWKPFTATSAHASRPVQAAVEGGPASPAGVVPVASSDAAVFLPEISRPFRLPFAFAPARGSLREDDSPARPFAPVCPAGAAQRSFIFRPAFRFVRAGSRVVWERPRASGDFSSTPADTPAACSPAEGDESSGFSFMFSFSELRSARNAALLLRCATFFYANDCRPPLRAALFPWPHRFRRVQAKQCAVHRVAVRQAKQSASFHRSGARHPKFRRHAGWHKCGAMFHGNGAPGASLQPTAVGLACADIFPTITSSRCGTPATTAFFQYRTLAAALPAATSVHAPPAMQIEMPCVQLASPGEHSTIEARFD